MSASPTPDAAHPRQDLFSVMVLTAAASMLAAWFAFETRPTAWPIPLIWLPSGIAWTVAARYGARPLTAAVVGTAVGTLIAGVAWQTAAIVAVVNSLVALSGLPLLRQAGRDFADLSTVKAAVLVLAVPGVLVSAIGSVVAFSLMEVVGKEPTIGTWAAVGAGAAASALGIVVAAPVLPALAHVRRLQRHQGLELAALVLATTLLALALALGVRGMSLLISLVVPLLIWATMRFRLLGAAITLCMMTVAIAAAAGFDAGIWVGDPQITVTLRVSVFLGICGLVAVVLQASLAERDALEARLIASEDRFRTFTDVASDWLWEQDANLRFTFVSAQNEKYSGIKPEAHYGKTRSETKPEGVTERQWQEHQALLEQRLPFRGFRFNRTDPSGRLHRLEISGQPIFDPDGQFQGYRGTGRDLSEIVEAQAAADEARTALLDALKHQTSGVALWSRDQKLIAWNLQYVELAGGEVVKMEAGRTYRDITTEMLRRGVMSDLTGDHTAIVDAMEARLASAPADYETQRNNRWLLISLRRTSDNGILQVVTDITPLKQREAALIAIQHELEDASRAKSEFLARMSHELRTPLNAILGFSEIMAGGYYGPLGSDRYQEYCESIRNSGAHLLDLINDILDMSKIEAGKFEIEPEVVPLDEALVPILDIASGAAGARGIRIEQIPAEAGWDVRADRRALKQMVLNLVSNAVKFSPPHGVVRVELARDETATTITVADDGPGIPPEVLRDLGRPFVQAPGNQAGGTGLGLAIGRALAELHSGSLVLTSTVGVGTRATIRLPHAGQGPAIRVA